MSDYRLLGLHDHIDWITAMCEAAPGSSRQLLERAADPQARKKAIQIYRGLRDHILKKPAPKLTNSVVGMGMVYSYKLDFMEFLNMDLPVEASITRVELLPSPSNKFSGLMLRYAIDERVVVISPDYENPALETPSKGRRKKKTTSPITTKDWITNVIKSAKTVFLHELIHVLDSLRMDTSREGLDPNDPMFPLNRALNLKNSRWDKAKANYDNKDPVQAANHPLESNAYFQGVAAEIEASVEDAISSRDARHIRGITDTLARSPVELANKVIQALPPETRQHLTPDTTKRFKKRTAGMRDEIMDRFEFEIQSLIFTSDRDVAKAAQGVYFQLWGELIPTEFDISSEEAKRRVKEVEERLIAIASGESTRGYDPTGATEDLYDLVKGSPEDFIRGLADGDIISNGYQLFNDVEAGDMAVFQPWVRMLQRKLKAVFQRANQWGEE